MLFSLDNLVVIHLEEGISDDITNQIFTEVSSFSQCPLLFYTHVLFCVYNFVSCSLSIIL